MVNLLKYLSICYKLDTKTFVARSLADARSESLGFPVPHPDTAGNSVAGKTANGSFVFTATQS